MSIQSAGILPYRCVDGKTEVLLVHPGGPFWAKKDEASWSVPKGITEEGETLMDAARREFQEETGCIWKEEETLVELGTIRQSGGKMITVFAVNLDLDADKVKSNTFEMEWPPKSGQMKEFPENDRASWFSLEVAKKKLFKGQAGFIDRLMTALGQSHCYS